MAESNTVSEAFKNATDVLALKETLKARRPKVDPPRINFIAAMLALVCWGLGLGATLMWNNVAPIVVGSVAGLIAAFSPKVAQQWERAIVLRLGRYAGLRGPGLFWIVPGIDQVSNWIDQRIITTSFAAEQTLTSDTVPVNVDAVLFWMVYDPEKAGARGTRLQKRGELGRPDRPARYHRPDSTHHASCAAASKSRPSFKN